MKERYPRVMYRRPSPPREVPAADFLTQDEAAALLRRRPPSLVGVLVATGRLKPATCGDRQPGVERASVEAELAYRTRPLWRTRTLLRTVWHFL